MSKEYRNYLNEHIGNVRKAFDWLKKNIATTERIPLTEYDWRQAERHIKYHDDTKWTPSEWNAYDVYFYGGNRSAKVVEDFNYAWLHHIHHQPHHWQHWILFEDDPEYRVPYRTLEIPKEYVIEMICDWWSFSWTKGDLTEIFSWYDDHKKTMILHPKTRKLVEDIISKIGEMLQGKSKEDGE